MIHNMVYMQILVNPIDNECNMYHFYRQDRRSNTCVKPKELPPEVKAEFKKMLEDAIKQLN